MNIDLVVPWVDGSDIEHIKTKNRYKQLLEKKVNDEVIGLARFKDNGELKYLLRSIEKNAKFIRYVFLVTNGQIPKWLNINHPKIKIVTHSQIMPKEALPTFNSSAIETCIANIPDLSDNFLYANDDFIIAKPINEKFFFTKEGYPISRLLPVFHIRQKGVYVKKINFTLNIFYKKFHKNFNLTEHHNIDAFYKPDVLSCINEFKEDFDRTCNSRFRAENNISKHIWSLYSFYIGHSKIKGYYISKILIYLVSIINGIKSLFSNVNQYMYNGNNTSKKSTFLKIKKQIYRFILNSTSFSNYEDYNIKYISLFCINDNEFSNDADRKRSMDFLNKLFPNKSSFEI
ncbi:Stealth CR1 domain-containing protein [Candidatus Ruminimicrobium bovinum]|uniref:Stealth CR1 domain-containing protein n=1 Tax=Candidatus Ruminimicrobium bovinum TaxID=3242779 RepID=UPI0039B96CC5